MTEQKAIEELHSIRPRGGIIPQKRAEAVDVAINALEEIQQYREIGTPDECLAAVEKQRSNKPQKVLLSYGTGYECKQCGNELSVNSFNGEYCHWCGQKLDWRDEKVSNYLISRSALISHIESERRQWGDDYDAEQILGDIEDFPTAYDVDKVVEQLENMSILSRPVGWTKSYEIIKLDDAIEIVKGGVVNGQ